MLACLSAWWRVLARAYMQVSKQDEDEWAAAFNGEAVQEAAANHTQVSQPVPTAKGPKDAKGSAVMDTPWTPAEQVYMCAHMCVFVCVCVFVRFVVALALPWLCAVDVRGPTAFRQFRCRASLTRCHFYARRCWKTP